MSRESEAFPPAPQQPRQDPRTLNEMVGITRVNGAGSDQILSSWNRPEFPKRIEDKK